MTVASKPANANYRAHYDETFPPKKRMPKVEDVIWDISRALCVEVVKIDGNDMTVCCALGYTFRLPLDGEGTTWRWPEQKEHP
jgi:hypothetical protein